METSLESCAIFTVIAVICAVLCPSRFMLWKLPVWLVSIIVSSILFVLAGLASFYTVAFPPLLYLAIRTALDSRGQLKLLLWFFILGVCLALGMHVIPGYQRYLIATDIHLGAHSNPLTLGFSFDKAFVGVLLFRTIFKDIQWRLSGRELIYLLVSVLCVFAVLWPFVLKFEFKLGWYLAVFLTLNLFITCVTEEAFFKGLIQKPLMGYAKKTYQSIALIVSMGVLFMLVHGQSLESIQYALAYTFVGSIYAAIYHFTRRIELAILLHFLVNALHIIFFAYPA